MTTMNLVPVPNNGLGSPGDGPGLFAVDPLGALYYCCKPYDGVSRIWLMTTTTIFLLLPTPDAPVITGYSTTATGASALSPIITGTIKSVPWKTRISFSGGSFVVNSNTVTWSYKLTLPAGTNRITATATYENDAGIFQSNTSVASNVLNVILVAPPAPPPPPPTITVNATMAFDKKSAYLYWYSTDTTTIKLNGGIYVNSSLTTPYPAIGMGLTITKSGNYTFTATGPGGSVSTVKTISLVGA
jgi:hypothetical protein